MAETVRKIIGEQDNQVVIPLQAVLTNEPMEIPSAAAVYGAIAIPQFEVVELTAAEIKALVATPKTMIAAPGAGKALDIISIFTHLEFVSAAMATSTVTGDFKIDTVSLATLTSAFIKSAASTNYKSAVGSGIIKVNTALTLSCQTTEYDTGDSTMTVYIAYRVIDMN